jgi:Metallo-beta-lactamase superfamily
VVDSTQAQTPDQEEPSLSPWLRQLWKGESSSNSSTINVDSSASSAAVSSMIAASEPYALATAELRERKNLLKENVIIDFDNFDNDDEPTQQKPKRTGGNGNNFDGKGYDGLGGGSSGDDEDDNDPELSSVDSSTGTIDRISSWDKINSDPKDTWPIDPNLYPHIRTSLTDIEFSNEQELLGRDTGLSICTLGTSAGGSCRLRSNSATVVRSGSFCYLVDAGEGVHRQFMLSRLRYNDISKIFITHMHADHVFGLASLLLSMQVARIKDAMPQSIEIYGPVGLYNFVAMTLALTCTEVRKIKIFIYELHGGTQRSMRFSGNRKAFPEFQHKVRFDVYILHGLYLR